MTPLTQKLREVTSTAHRKIDDALNLSDPSYDNAAYAALLSRWYTLLLPFESAISRHLPRAIVAARRKTPLLLDDLKFLRINHRTLAEADKQHQLPAETPAEAIGSFYVIEGSTLGAQYLSAHFSRTLGMTEDHGGKFFAGYGAETKARWLETKQLIDAVPEQQHSQVIDAANRAFEKTQFWLTSTPELPATTTAPHTFSAL